MSRSHGIILSLLIVARLTHADGWSTNWPSQTHPRAGKMHLAEAYTAIVERCQATGTSLPVAPTWYRFARTDLINLKTNLVVLIPKFVDIGNKVGGNYTNYFLVNTNATTLPTFTVTGLLVQCGMPINYLTYTPWRSLTGLGANTNDSTVIYPHGFTNSTTIAGGTNFPSGRSTWYDTDYGVGSITTLLSRLTDIQKTPTSVSISYAGTSGAGTGMSATNTYAENVAGIDSYFTNSNPVYPALGEFSGVWNWPPEKNYAWKGQAAWSYGVTNIYTNCEVQVDWAMNVWNSQWSAGDIGITSTFANVSFTFTYYAMNLLDQDTVSAGTGWLTSDLFGSTNTPCGIALPSNPSAYPTEPWRHTLGWECRGTHHALLSYRFLFR